MAEDYVRMVDADIIPPERRVGLWRGQLYEKMPWKTLAHCAASSLISLALIRAMPAGWCTWTNASIIVDELTVPFPDLSLVRGDPNVYCRRGSFPGAREVGLVIEVADVCLGRDLTEILRTYARAGLPVYWVVNLVANRVEVYSDPRPAGEGQGEEPRYAKAEAFEPGQDVPLVLDGREVARIPARDLLPEGAP
jgi:Uma2 family endonuclease